MPILAKSGLTHDQISLAIEQIDTPSELRAAIADPAAFAQRLLVMIKGPEGSVQMQMPNATPQEQEGTAQVQSGGKGIEALEAVSSMQLKFKAAIDKLKYTKSQLIRLYVVGSTLLVGFATFIFWGQDLWRATGSSFSYESLLMPFVPIFSQMKAKGILGHADTVEKVKTNAESPQRGFKMAQPNGRTLGPLRRRRPVAPAPSQEPVRF